MVDSLNVWTVRTVYRLKSKKKSPTQVPVWFSCYATRSACVSQLLSSTPWGVVSEPLRPRATPFDEFPVPRRQPGPRRNLVRWLGPIPNHYTISEMDAKTDSPALGSQSAEKWLIKQCLLFKRCKIAERTS